MEGPHQEHQTENREIENDAEVFEKKMKYELHRKKSPEGWQKTLENEQEYIRNLK